jgi:hypothetical protein
MGHLQAAQATTSIIWPHRMLLLHCISSVWVQQRMLHNVQLPIHCLSYGLCCECLLMQTTGDNEHSATARDNCWLQEPQHPLFGPIQCCCITAFPLCGSNKGCYNVQLPIHSVLDCVKCLLIQAACENEHSATARDNCRLLDP